MLLPALPLMTPETVALLANENVSLPLPPVRLAKPVKADAVHGPGVVSFQRPGVRRAVVGDQGVRRVGALEALDVRPAAADAGRGRRLQVDRDRAAVSGVIERVGAAAAIDRRRTPSRRRRTRRCRCPSRRSGWGSREGVGAHGPRVGAGDRPGVVRVGPDQGVGRARADEDLDVRPGAADAGRGFRVPG